MRYILVTFVLAASRLCAQSATQAAIDYFNLINPSEKRDTWEVYLGLNQTETNNTRKDYRDTNNPITGQPFPKNTPVFVFGQDFMPAEVLRMPFDHFDVHLFTAGDWHDLEHGFRSTDYALCNSNGCAVLISLVESGHVRVKHILATGSDRTTAPINPAKLNGADITFFVHRTDPVPLIPAPELVRAGSETPGFGYKIYFGPGDPRPVSRVITLDDPPGKHLFDAHAMDTYFPSLKTWLSHDGPEQRDVRKLLDLPSTRPAATTPPSAPPPRPTSSGNDRAGVYAGVPISEGDFVPSKAPKGGPKP